MSCTVKFSKITRKGQVTVPKRIRNILGSQIVEFVITDSGVMIKPVESVAGSLRRYAGKSKAFNKIREEVWKEVAEEKGTR